MEGIRSSEINLTIAKDGRDLSSNQRLDAAPINQTQVISIEDQSRHDTENARLTLLQILNTIPKVNPDAFIEEGLLSQTQDYFVHVGTLNGEKVVRKQLSAVEHSEAVINKFKTSIAIMAKLDGGDGTIVLLKGVANIDSINPIVYMEYMELGNLRDKLASEMFWVNYLEIAVQVARGVAQIHALNLVHRDINSYHIVLDKSGVAKLTGMTHSRVESSGSMTMGVGCTRWAAPETMREGELYSSKADIYSLGLVLIELHTQKKPYSHMVNKKGVLLGDFVLGEMIAQAKENDPVFNHDIHDCPAWYQQLALECVSFNPKNRPSAVEVVRRLEENLFKLGLSKLKMSAAVGEKAEIVPPEPIRIQMTLVSVEARSLRTIQAFGYKSPSAQLSVAGTHHNTNQPNDGPDPLWNESGYHFDKVDMIDMTLEIDISYKNPNASEVGVCTVPIYKLYSDTAVKEDVFFSGMKSGTLKIEAKFTGDIKTHLNQHLDLKKYQLQSAANPKELSKKIEIIQGILAKLA